MIELLVYGCLLGGIVFTLGYLFMLTSTVSEDITYNREKLVELEEEVIHIKTKLERLIDAEDKRKIRNATHDIAAQLNRETIKPQRK